ncbi:WD40/YVTN/BNR-like repeat-containing protein [Undibacterium sp. JH2W]|uniref:WD40/YVTN/BNR-like repeat-containing protein n=1 Tax=Undibacterium sp. JH2W TaxID=3413037 RepID=UPI003BF166F3
MKLAAIAFAVLISTMHSVSAADAWIAQTSGTEVELRGLSVVNSQVAWASGAKATVLRTVDGEHWQSMQVAGADGLDFRDIHAFDAQHAIIMSAGPGALSRLYQTSDGGSSWQLLKTNEARTGFWDAISFSNSKQGMLFGDPVDGQFQILSTTDGGLNWQEHRHAGLTALANEGAFAASGTCLATYGSKHAWIVSGSAEQARVFASSDAGMSWSVANLPLPAAAASKGAFSVAFLDEKNGMVVGGDYKLPQLDSLNGARTEDGGKTWLPSPVLPQGFMSVITTVPGAAWTYVAAGLAGSGISRDAGKTWQVLGQTPMNTVAFANAQTGWAVGPKGLLMKFNYVSK